ncbi:GNAT family N-acetyltransferase [Anaerosolibacter sp.]|uniref:GNAT family N-acetyltransferase n=1 Tax=Anaerosolibacter sp. TaxID=1872527 RepID=UPI0039EF57B1
MLTVKKLEQFTIEDQESFGFNGFKTDKIYAVEKRECEDELIISVKIKDLEETYQKKWSRSSSSEKFFQEVIKQNLSFGAYIYEELAGVLIASEIKWNNSLWIENIIISERYRGNGIGKALLDNLMKLAAERKIRIIGLETQGSNYPAIQFYKKHGFEIDGIDFSLYPRKDESNPDVAIIMKRKVI